MSIVQNIRDLNLSDSIKLICVTKYSSFEEINEAIDAGIEAIGENRVQDAKIKFPYLKSEVEKHLIGHLQTNKVKDAIQIFDMIQSVDSIKLANEINKRAETIKKVMPVLLQINIGEEEQKYGFEPDNFMESIKEVIQLPNLDVQGLMAMAPLGADPRPFFKQMKIIFDQFNSTNKISHKLKWLSMGMSGDYKIAIEEGANMVRIGSALFK